MMEIPLPKGGKTTVTVSPTQAIRVARIPGIPIPAPDREIRPEVMVLRAEEVTIGDWVDEGIEVTAFTWSAHPGTITLDLAIHHVKGVYCHQHPFPADAHQDPLYWDVMTTRVDPRYYKHDELVTVIRGAPLPTMNRPTSECQEEHPEIHDAEVVIHFSKWEDSWTSGTMWDSDIVESLGSTPTGFAGPDFDPRHPTL